MRPNELETALRQGNNALRAGQYAQAIRHYAQGLLEGHNSPPSHQTPLIINRKRQENNE